MPSIPIHIPKQSSNAPSPLPQLLQTPGGLALVEIQGTIHVPNPDDTSDPTQNQVGRLVFPLYDASLPPEDVAWMKRVELFVGKHQKLTGEVRKLPKPYGILRKMEISEDKPEESLEIVDIVKYKIIFSRRPEPVGEK